MNLSERDGKNIWHPYTQHQITSLPIPIIKGEGAYLYDDKGKAYLDLASSWLVNLHGHSHPVIAKAIYEQALQLEHVMFAGFTHEPAVKLAEEILNILPTSFNRIFYSDNGSTAIEVALKMSFQYWRNQGKNKNKIIAFEKAYHGDTFGAMALGKTCGYFKNFNDITLDIKFFDFPHTWMHDKTINDRESNVLNEIKDYIFQYKDEIAAIIIEPLVQAIAGMHICREDFLLKLQTIASENDILLIYDEVFTGFGRTGHFFAATKSKTSPDIICLAKGLTGGFLPLAITACNEKIYKMFLGSSFEKALAHGHSYTANPLGCAAALASLEILKSDEVQEQIKRIEAIHIKNLKKLSTLKEVEKTRYCGTIAAFDVANDAEYGGEKSIQLREFFLEKGLLLRPFANVIYFVPPYCIKESELDEAYEVIYSELVGVLA